MGGSRVRLEPQPWARSGGGGAWVARSTSPDSRRGQWPPAPHSPPCARQVNMAIGILVFNRLVSKDGIADKKLKERAG